MEKIVLGIDLGTTYSAAAYVDEQGRLVIIKSPNGETTLASVVQVKGDKVIVGDAALNEWIVDEEHVVRWVKRSMGERDYQFPRERLFAVAAGAATALDEGRIGDDLRGEFAGKGVGLSESAEVYVRTEGEQWIVIDGERGFVLMRGGGNIAVYQGMSAVEISAEILKVLKGYAETQLGQKVRDAVITCPAYFNTVEITNTKRAGELAGFNVLRIVQEPVAAAVYYGIEHIENGEKVLVCDLGGGTFDATVLTLEGDVFKPMSTMGDRKLGGHEWTSELVDLVAEKVRAETGEDPRNDLLARQVLYENCERSKRAFAQVAEVPVSLPWKGRTVDVRVTRDEFEARTEYLMTNMVSWCQQSLEKIGLKWKQIDRILMVGGSSRLRRMAAALEEESGKKPVLCNTPDLAVAYGAAIMAKGKVRTRKSSGGVTDSRPGGGLTDVAWERPIVRSLGTRVFDRDRVCIMNALIIPHGTATPVSKSSDDFEISVNGQEFFDVPIVEFDNETLFDAICCYRFWCIADAKRGERIRITFHYDNNGALTAEAADVGTGKTLRCDAVKYQEPNIEELSVRLNRRWVVFALDVSGSMEGDKIRRAKEALIKNARELIELGDGECLVGVASFSSDADIVCRPTADADALAASVRGITTGTTTAMDEGINVARELVLGAPAGADRDVVLVTDGMPDGDRRQSTCEAAARTKSMGVDLSVLGIGSGDVDEDFLKVLTPNFLVIDSLKDMGKQVGTLLTRASNARGAKTPKSKGGLRT